jgi:hypothetical protein
MIIFLKFSGTESIADNGESIRWENLSFDESLSKCAGVDFYNGFAAAPCRFNILLCCGTPNPISRTVISHGGISF